MTIEIMIVTGTLGLNKERLLLIGLAEIELEWISSSLSDGKK